MPPSPGGLTHSTVVGRVSASRPDRYLRRRQNHAFVFQSSRACVSNKISTRLDFVPIGSGDDHDPIRDIKFRQNMVVGKVNKGTATEHMWVLGDLNLSFDMMAE